VLLPVAQFAYNATPQEGIKMPLFKVNYGYALRTSLSLKQTKKLSKVGKKRAEKLMVLHKELYKSAKMVQKKWKHTTIKKDLRDQTLKKETKCGYYIKTLKINN